ncbi:MAG: SAM-dependent methyltransferase [Acidimicrobiales bacterium]
MESGRPSRTAAQNALFRALDARHPLAERVADDRYAERFLPTEFRALARAGRVGLLRVALERYIDRRWPCVRGGVVARTRVIDDEVASSAAGVEQVLILGAGFDSRAYRIGALDDLPVFEVDHPDTQRMKRLALAHVQAHRTVSMVPVVFGRDELDSRLEVAGFSAGLKTLVLWEGVTNYLDSKAVDTTMRLVVQFQAPGSPFLFTYVHKGVIDGSVEFDGARTTVKAVKNVGEPFTFGFDPGEVGEYLSQHGFTLRWDTTVRQAGAKVWPDEGDLPDYYHVVKATKD